MILDYLALAYEGIKHRKLRSWLTMLGIFIGIASVVSLFSLGQGLEVAIDEQFQEIGANKIFIQPGSSMGFTSTFSSAVLNDNDMETAKSVNGVDDGTGLTVGTVRIRFNDRTLFLYIHGLPVDETQKLAVTAHDVEI
jgi:hypothetical protein